MSFVQVEYPVFLLVVFALYWALGRRRAWQNVLLLLASFVFYGWLHWWFVPLMLGAALLDYAVARAIVRWPRWRRAGVALSVTLNLGLLGYFKYTDFFAAQAVAALRAAGVDAHWSGLDVLLPVGISFYTFQTIGYTIDVARGELKPRRNLVDYLLYVSMFAQLVAGPIERAGRLLPQIERDRTLDADRFRSAVSLAVWGGFKKLVIADSIAPYVDKVFVLDDPAGPLVWAATAGFMIQIFADFSGYTDIARGSARLLGFELGENFREPFLARTTIEFWQRWHISLSTWLRDYLLGPLVGDAGAGRLRFALATVATFVIIGFWHGPSWNFVLFGLYHGLWVVVYGLAVRRIPRWAQRVPLGGALAVGFHLVAVGLVGTLLFRERHVDRIVQHLSKSPVSASPEAWVATGVVLSVTAAAAAPLLVQWAYARWLRPRVEHTPLHLPLQTTCWAAAAVLMFVFYRTTLQDFVYFQF
ncbi:MAG: MBOAT family O-acyltransferase [Myxococcota bacterium]